MSWSVSSPMFPSMLPRPADPLWFSVDKPVDEEAELAKEEQEHTQTMQKIAQQGGDVTPIGKTSAEQFEENDDEDDEDDDSESDQMTRTRRMLIWGPILSKRKRTTKIDQ